MDERGAADAGRVPAYGLDGIDVCLFSHNGVQKAVLVVYPTGDITLDCQAVLRHNNRPGSKPGKNGWYEFWCELIVDRVAPAQRIGSLYPPLFYTFDVLPDELNGIRVFSSTVTSQAPREEFHPEITLGAGSIPNGAFVGESFHKDVSEAYRDAMAAMQVLPGAGRPIPRLKGVVYALAQTNAGVRPEVDYVLRVVVEPVSAHVEVHV